MRYIYPRNKGIITGLVLIVLSVILFYGFHLPENGKSQYVVLTTFIIGLLWVLIDFHIRQTDAQKFKEYFSEGFKAFIVITLLMVCYSYIFYKNNPQIMEKGIAENNALISEQGNRTNEEINENAEKLRSIFMPMMLFITTMKFLILGSLVTVVTAGFLSQKAEAKK
ncbi:MAG: DUF4199 domain-containing protein [Ferruginibacter sp.]|nr:DUF4199 domain-containing protein [Ferruginibacter sp.]